GDRRGPLLVAVLVAASLLLLPRRAGRATGVLDELPAVCGRIAVVWLALAALVAAYAPQQALAAPTLLLGFVVQAAAGLAGRGLVHRRRRVRLLHRPHAALVVGPAPVARRVAAALLRPPACGVRPAGGVSVDPAGGGGVPGLTTGAGGERALSHNGVREA